MSPRRQVTYSRRPNHAARSAHARGDRLFRTYDTSYIQPKRSNVPHYVFLAVLALLGIGILWFVGSSVASCVSPKVELLAEGQQGHIHRQRRRIGQHRRLPRWWMPSWWGLPRNSPNA